MGFLFGNLAKNAAKETGKQLIKSLFKGRNLDDEYHSDYPPYRPKKMTATLDHNTSYETHQPLETLLGEEMDGR